MYRLVIYINYYCRHEKKNCLSYFQTCAMASVKTQVNVSKILKEVHHVDAEDHLQVRNAQSDQNSHILQVELPPQLYLLFSSSYSYG